MGASHALQGSPFEVAGVVGTEHEAAGVLPDGVIGADAAEVGHRQQAGHVGIVHQNGAAESIYLICVDLSVFGVLHHRVFLEGAGYLVGQGPAFAGELALLAGAFQNFGGLAQGADREEVGGDEEFQYAGVVGGTEG